MADVKWIKICTDIFDDEKTALIDGLPERDGIIVIWFKLLCLAGRQNNGGVFMLNDKIAYTDEMLATIFRRPVNTVRLALNTFEQFGMIDIVNNAITIPNWDKHQSLDKFERAQEKNRKRVAKYREKQRLLAEGNAYGNVTVTQCNADRKEKEKNRIDKEAEVVCADAPNYDDPDDKLKILKGNIILSENQVADLLNKMELEIFDEYIARLSNYINNNNITVQSHYATILKWYNEDRAVKA